MAHSSFKEIKDVLAPPAAEVGSNFLKLGNKYVKALFVFTYPRFLSSGWFTAIINMPNLLDISIFIHPVDTAIALRNLRKKAAQVQAQISEQEEKGMVRDPVLETAFQDIETLRDALQQAREKLYNAGLYITVYGDTPEEVKKLEEEISTNLEGKLVYAKPAIFQQLEGFASVLPLGLDKLSINSPLNSGPVSSFFPFVSADLTSDKGILYGINAHNNSLVIFDRFSLENANVVIFAKSGAGKSYAAKLEIIRSLMFGVDVLVIDPENEYKMLAESMAGSFFNISLTSENHVNPLEIPVIPEDEDPAEVLRSHIVNLIGLLKLMLGTVTNEEDAILDRAITETYASREIVPGKDFSKAQPPLLEDLETVLYNMEGGRGLSERLYKFTKGSFAGFVNQPTNVDIKNRLIVFSMRDLEEELRPIAVYIILAQAAHHDHRRGVGDDEAPGLRGLSLRPREAGEEVLPRRHHHHAGGGGLPALRVRPPHHHELLAPDPPEASARPFGHRHRRKNIRPYRCGEKFAPRGGPQGQRFRPLLRGPEAYRH